MSKADELLNRMLETAVAPTLVNPETEPHIVIGDNRVIEVPSELQRIAVQYDHNVETVTFDCPRYWDGLDMSTMRIYINYKRADSAVGMSIPKNVTVDEIDDSIMHFDWTITRGATLVPGTLSFNVCVKKPTLQGTEENHWNSEVNTQMRVSEGLEYEEQKNPQAADLISDLIDRMEKTEETVGKAGLIISTEQMNNLLAQFDGLKAELAKRTETVVFNATIATSKWSAGSAPYTQLVSVPGLKATDSPHATPVYSTTQSIAVDQEIAWNRISEGEARDNGVMFTCFEDKPTVDIPIQIEVFRTWVDPNENSM